MSILNISSLKCTNLYSVSTDIKDRTRKLQKKSETLVYSVSIDVRTEYYPFRNDNPVSIFNILEQVLKIEIFAGIEKYLSNLFTNILLLNERKLLPKKW